MERITNKLFAGRGYVILGIGLASVILAVLGLTGISGHEALFFSAWALALTLPVFLFTYSVRYRSPLWTLASAAMLIFLCMMLVDRLRGGGHWLPVMDGRMLCYSCLMFSAAGAVAFCFTGWRKSLAVLVLTGPAAAALYLCGAPLWLCFLTLFIGFGYLFYGFRVMLLQDAVRRHRITLS